MREKFGASASLTDPALERALAGVTTENFADTRMIVAVVAAVSQRLTASRYAKRK